MNTAHIQKLAEEEARFHFHPAYSKDGFTACTLCFIAGFKAALQSQDETEYLLSTKENRRVLLKSVKDLETSGNALSSDIGDAPFN